MTRFVSKPKLMDLRQIVRLGASPGYVQLDDESVIKLSHHCEIQMHDWVLFVDGEPVDVLTPAELDNETFSIESDIDPMAVEDQIVEVNFVDGDPQTLCAITMKDGRTFAGSVVSLNGDTEERRQFAYNDALVRAFESEVEFLQRLHHYAGECQ